MDDQLFIQLAERLENRLENKMESLFVKFVTSNRVGGMELAQEVTGYKPRTIYRHVAAGMPHHKKGKKLMFSEKELREYMVDSDEAFEKKMRIFHASKRPGRKAARVLAAL